MSEHRDRDRSTELQLHDTFRLSADGVAKALGDLEARVMGVVWSLGGASSARSVHQRVALEHSVTIHTVITVLNKLVRKGLLRREKEGEVLHFSACVTESEFRAEVSRRLMEGILSLGSEAATTSFVDVLARRDPAQLEALGELIRARIREEEDR
jgi:predicted transcriptional regulator